MSTYSTASSLYVRQAVHTPAVWLLATSPALYLVADTAVAILVPATSAPLVSALVFLLYLLGAAGATMADRAALLRLGYRWPAATWWFLLSPGAYLIARSVRTHREGAAGWAPIPVWFVLALLPVIAGFLLALVVPVLVAFSH